MGKLLSDFPPVGDFGGFSGVKWRFLTKNGLLDFLVVDNSEKRTLGILEKLTTTKSAKWRFWTILVVFFGMKWQFLDFKWLFCNFYWGLMSLKWRIFN